MELSGEDKRHPGHPDGPDRTGHSLVSCPVRPLLGQRTCVTNVTNVPTVSLLVCGVPSVSSQIARPAEVALVLYRKAGYGSTDRPIAKTRSRNDGIEVIATPTDLVRHGQDRQSPTLSEVQFRTDTDRVAPRPATPGERSTLVVDPKYMPSLALGALRSENAGTPRVRRSLCLLR